ncbi:hypothetical protein [Elizabethkingia meningoseptica]|uniref:hypothetical protein n=1 Tax=Elizabethkingia meningoseptica TaxID=238 RepID=UPI00315893C4
METPKEQAIKAAYGEYWDKVKDHIDDDGWFNNIEHDFYFSEWGNSSIELEYEGSFCRPKSLYGIENNNSWTRIESEEDLPDKYGQYWVFTSNGNIMDVYYDEHDKTWDGILDFFEVKATHWQQIVKPKPPIF